MAFGLELQHHLFPVSPACWSTLQILDLPASVTACNCMSQFLQKSLSLSIYICVCVCVCVCVYMFIYCCCLVAKSCLTVCDPMDCSTPGFPVLHHLPEFAQVHVHWVSDAIQTSPLLPSSPSACNLAEPQGLYTGASWVVKNVPTNTGDIRDAGVIPGWGRSSWRRAWEPTLVFSHREPHRGAWWATKGCKESETMEATLHACMHI